MSDKLQPCPFCGDVNPSMQGQTDRTLSYEPSAWVECETCGAQSRGFCRTSEAMEAWNRRATSPARDNEGGQRASTPDGIDLAAQIAHQKEIFCGDCATFGDDSKWSIKSGSILASLIELQDARTALSAAEQRATLLAAEHQAYACHGESLTNTLKRLKGAADTFERRAEVLGDRANILFGALLEFHNAFHNRGETTSLHEWNERMKRADEQACQVLPIAIASGAGEAGNG